MHKIFSMIGFAQKAGKISSGTSAARASVLRHRAKLLVLSNDIAENSRESLEAVCIKNGIPWVVVGDKFQLGTAVGKAYRVAVSINDTDMAEVILKAVKGMGDEAKNMGVVEWPK